MSSISFKYNWMLLGKTSIFTPLVTLGRYSLTPEKPGQRTRKDCPCYLVQRSWFDRQSMFCHGSWLLFPDELEFSVGFSLLKLQSYLGHTLSGVLLWNAPSFPCTLHWEGRDSLTMFIWLIHFKTGTLPTFRLLASDFLCYSDILQQIPEKKNLQSEKKPEPQPEQEDFFRVSESA